MWTMIWRSCDRDERERAEEAYFIIEFGKGLEMLDENKLRVINEKEAALSIDPCILELDIREA